MARFTLSLLAVACATMAADAFVPAPPVSFGVVKTTASSSSSTSAHEPTTTSLSMSDMANDFLMENSHDTKDRIQGLVDDHPVLLFMKGNQLFPQCGFSNTAVQILNTFNLDFHSVDVLSDDAVRQGIKDFSQWPTIPQLYVAGEFVGGCDIMIEMFQQGELAEMIEKAKADMV